MVCTPGYYLLTTRTFTWFMGLQSHGDRGQPCPDLATYHPTEGSTPSYPPMCYGFEQQQRSERASRSRNCTAVCEYLRSMECQLCE